jgi:hypothetical protein
MLKMTSMRFNARFNTTHCRPPHCFRDVGAVADSLTGIHNAMVSTSSLSTGAAYTRVSTGKNPDDSNLQSVEAMQWVLLYISIGHDRCY